MLMARKRFAKRRHRNVVPKKTQRVRKLLGQEGQTTVEKIAGWTGQVSQVARSVSLLAGFINSETKYIDQALNATIANTGASGNFAITQIAEGDDVSQRNGRWILAKSLQARFSFTQNASASNTLIGWAFVMDKKAAIALSATPWTDVFSTADPNALINRNESERFVILRRGVEDLSINGQRSVHRKLYFPLKGIHLKYNGTAATNTDQNMIYLVLISSEATNTPTIVGNIRFDYHDN